MIVLLAELACSLPVVIELSARLTTLLVKVKNDDENEHASTSPVPLVVLPKNVAVAMFCIFANVTASFVISAVSAVPLVPLWTAPLLTTIVFTSAMFYPIVPVMPPLPALAVPLTHRPPLYVIPFCVPV